MKYIRHKNMRDVFAEVLEHEISQAGRIKFKVLWWNRLGTIEDPSPFPIAAGASRLAVEDIQVDEYVFIRDWEILE